MIVLVSGKSPDWAKDAIWYQIFPERFYNGDLSNDPTIETLEGTWPYEQQTEWETTPWTDDWYKPQPWELKNKQGFYYNCQLRRYGGDIQGIIDKLDYLQDLGINAIYLNPVFESASSHKYGATMYRHIDNNFGPNPKDDELLWETEIPIAPSTWKWTSADKLFLSLIKDAHARDIRIIIDGVFNHVGIPFWALQDVKKNGENSRYKNWFVIKSFDDPVTPEDEFDYQGWFGVKDLPELQEDENGLIAPVQDHIHNIVKRWMDPNGDGDPSDGIDGWRLDVAEMVNMNFWTTFSGWVKEINPNAYITGEVWWEDYFNNKMFNAAPWIETGGFDAVMNYRFADAMYKYFNDENNRIKPSELDQLLAEIRNDYGLETSFVLQNLMDSHDCERLASAVVNPDRWIDHANNLQYNPEFKVRAPNEYERQKQRVILAFQFTYIGAPYIYYGDEVGMWGADDPDERKPMVWKEFTYEDESHHPLGLKRQTDKIYVDKELLNYYKFLISLRNTYPALRRGNYRTVLLADGKGLFAFERQYYDERILAIFNSSNITQSLSVKNLLGNEPEEWKLLLTLNESTDITVLEPKSALVFQKP